MNNAQQPIPGFGTDVTHAANLLKSAASLRRAVIDQEPLSLVDEEINVAVDSPAKKIQAMGSDAPLAKKEWTRKTIHSGTGASRVKSFHAKYSEQGLEFLDNAINIWLDKNPEIDVKFVTPTVMTFEGKIREPALVLNVWY